MEELLKFLVHEITGEEPKAIEKETVDGIITYRITAPKKHMAILIGKGGRIISSIRTIARVKGGQERINIELQESTE